MTVRVQAGRKSPVWKSLSRLQGLSHLPVRPHSARAVMAAFAETAGGDSPDATSTGVSIDLGGARGALDLDPGWVLAERTRPGRVGPLEIVANTAWWPATLASGSVHRGDAAPLAPFDRRRPRLPYVGSRERRPRSGPAYPCGAAARSRPMGGSGRRSRLVRALARRERPGRPPPYGALRPGNRYGRPRPSARRALGMRAPDRRRRLASRRRRHTGLGRPRARAVEIDPGSRARR